MEKDYYTLLGVEKMACQDEIKKNFRKLAKQYHPDGREKGDGEQFKKIHDAYEVLTNTTKRKEYDDVLSRLEREKETNTTAHENDWWNDVVAQEPHPPYAGADRATSSPSTTPHKNNPSTVPESAGVWYGKKKILYSVGIFLLILFLCIEGVPAIIQYRADKSPVSNSDTVPFKENMREMQTMLSTEDVVQLQTMLSRDETIYPLGAISGFYGEETHRALIRFQEKYGLPAEGYYGAQTRTKIVEVLGDANISSKVVLSRITVRFVNQYGVEYIGTERDILVTVVDARGQRVPGEFVRNTKGYFEFSSNVPEGAYTIYWPKSNTSTWVMWQGEKVLFKRFYEAGSFNFMYVKSPTLMLMTIPQTTSSLQGATFITFTPVSDIDGELVRFRESPVLYGENGERIGSFGSKGEERYVDWNMPLAGGTYTILMKAYNHADTSVSFVLPDLAVMTDVQVAEVLPIYLGRVRVTN